MYLKKEDCMSQSFNTSTVSVTYTLTALTDAVRIALEDTRGNSAWVVLSGEKAKNFESALRKHLSYQVTVYSEFIENGFWSGSSSNKGIRVQLRQVTPDLLTLHLHHLV